MSQSDAVDGCKYQRDLPFRGGACQPNEHTLATSSGSATESHVLVVVLAVQGTNVEDGHPSQQIVIQRLSSFVRHVLAQVREWPLPRHVVVRVLFVPCQWVVHTVIGDMRPLGWPFA
jgi:hypothetical protein